MKVFSVVRGRTFGAHDVILEKVSKSTALEIIRDWQDCDVIMIFCPIISHVRSDVEAAMRDIPGIRNTFYFFVKQLSSVCTGTLSISDSAAQDFYICEHSEPTFMFCLNLPPIGFDRPPFSRAERETAAKIFSPFTAAVCCSCLSVSVSSCLVKGS